MGGGEEKHLEDCSVSNALGTWVFSVAGALLAIPVGIKRKSLAPLVFFGTTGRKDEQHNHDNIFETFFDSL